MANRAEAVRARELRQSLRARPKEDPRPWHTRVEETFVVWGYILGLSTLAIVWTLIALAAIGNGTIRQFKYYIPDPTPSAVPFNQVEHFPGQARE